MFRLLPIVAWLVLAACNSNSPPIGPEEKCATACEAKVKACSARECGRGCNLVLDKLVESEGGRILSCMMRAKTRCDDATWAECASLTGVHVDGGPPAPPPPLDD